jgi:hypothetical protein
VHGEVCQCGLERLKRSGIASGIGEGFIERRGSTTRSTQAGLDSQESIEGSSENLVEASRPILEIDYQFGLRECLDRQQKCSKGHDGGLGERV